MIYVHDVNGLQFFLRRRVSYPRGYKLFRVRLCADVARLLCRCCSNLVLQPRLCNVTASGFDFVSCSVALGGRASLRLECEHVVQRSLVSNGGFMWGWKVRVYGDYYLAPPEFRSPLPYNILASRKNATPFRPHHE